MEVLGLEHIDLTVSDLARSTVFYACVLESLGFERFSHPAGHTSWSNGKFTIAIRPPAPEFAGAQFNRYRVGLHHFALKVRQRADIDTLHRVLAERRFVVLDPPAEYPEYGRGYYAIFFADPDGLKLEAVHFPWGYWARVQSEGHDARPRYNPDA